MLAFINNIPASSKIVYHLPFSARQKRIGEELYKNYLLEDDTEPDIMYLHRFIVSIFDTPTSQAPEGRSLFLSVLALRAVEDDGNFMAPERVTPELARLHYLCNIAIIIEGERQGSDSDSSFLQYDKLNFLSTTYNLMMI